MRRSTSSKMFMLSIVLGLAVWVACIVGTSGDVSCDTGVQDQKMFELIKRSTVAQEKQARALEDILRELRKRR